MGIKHVKLQDPETGETVYATEKGAPGLIEQGYKPVPETEAAAAPAEVVDDAPSDDAPSDDEVDPAPAPAEDLTDAADEAKPKSGGKGKA